MPVIDYIRGRDVAPGIPRVFLACPSGSGDWCAPFMASMHAGADALRESGIAVDLCTMAGNCHVDDARNALVRQFLLTDCTDLVFLDADVGFRPADLVRLVSYDRDVVAGIYPKKQDDEDYPVLMEPGVPIVADADGCISKGVLGLPTGFLRIRRAVLEKLAAAESGRAWRGQDHAEGAALYHPIFERAVLDGRRRSGDYAFSAKWRAMEGELAFDPEMRLSHTGPKTWEGCIADFWRRKTGSLPADFYDAVSLLRSGDGSDDVFLRLYRAWGNAQWSMLPDALMAVWRLCLNAGGDVLETGSGLSTLVAAIALQRAGRGKVYALEHDLAWSEKMRGFCVDLGMTAAEVIYSPLRRTPAGHVVYDCLPYLGRGFAAGLIDGPPRRYGRDGLFREEAFASALRGAQLLIDDVDDVSVMTLVRAHAGDRAVHVLGTDGHKHFALLLKDTKANV